MESKEARREVARKFKEQKPPLGVYAIRCLPTGRVWVGASRNLNATRNGCWFALRSGGHMDKSLQAEWNAHGEPGFRYEILEKIDPDLHPLEIAGLLKEKRNQWVAELSAGPLN